MKCVINTGGLHLLAELLSSIAHEGSVEVVVATKEPVSLFFDHALYTNTSLLRDIFIVAHAYAQVSYRDVFQQEERLLTVSIEAFKGAHVDYQFFAHGQNLSKTIITRCSDANAQIDVSGVYIATGNQSVSIITNQQHEVGHTSSSVIVNGYAQDASLASYEGDIFIAQDASECDVHQKNKNITCGSARIYARPVLRVYNKDVSCSHASATGQLSDESLLFAQARGMSEKQARLMVLQGFLCDTITDEILQKKIATVLKSL